MFKNILISLSLLISFNLLAQTPSVSINSVNLSLTTPIVVPPSNDTIFLLPIELDAFVSNISAFQGNIMYDASKIIPYQGGSSSLSSSVSNVNSSFFISMLASGLDIPMVDGGSILVNTFPMCNGMEMMSIAYASSSEFDLNTYNNCNGNLFYIPFQAVNCMGSVNVEFVSGECSGTYTNPNQQYSFFLGGTSVSYDVQSGTMNVNNGTVANSSVLSTVLNYSDPFCYNDNTGSATVNVSGGISPYIYNWSTGSSNSSVSSLSAGNYSVTVTDGCGDSFTDNFTLINPTIISNNTSVTDALCFGDFGSASFVTSGGVGPYNYTVNNNSGNPINLPAGSYSLDIVDNNGCTYTESFSISEPSEVTYSFTTDSASCYDECDGTADITNISGGTPPYSQDWYGEDPNELCAGGGYVVDLEDANGCTYSISYDIYEPNEIFVSISQNAQDLTMSVSGGTPPYEYIWAQIQGNDTIFVFYEGATYTPTNPPMNNGDIYGVVLDDYGCEGVAMINISFLSIDNLISNNLNIYPNPFRTFTKLDFSNPQNKEFIISLYDNKGDIVFKDKTTNNNYILSSNNLAKGNYYIEIHNDTEFYQGKIVLH